MLFKVDEEAAKVLEQLCDLALRQGGIQALKAVQMIMSTSEIIKPEVELEEVQEED